MIKITKVAAICNLGNNLDEIFHNILSAKLTEFKISSPLPQINDEKFNLRCNQLLLHCINQIKPDINNFIKRYNPKKIATVIATTNTGIDKFEETGNKEFLKMSNPAEFVRNYLGLDGAAYGISTACSSGIKAFSTAKRLIESGICDAAIVGGTDELSRFPLAGFKSLEVLSEKRSNPFSKNRCGMNISESAAIFLVEKEGDGINILGIGETSDAYHAATPNPEGTQAVRAITLALSEANLAPDDIDYINLHGTGTITNDLMEGNAISKVFGNKTPVSSTKPLTGHCLGAAASIEVAICYALLKSNQHILPPHVYDGEYDTNIPKINLVLPNIKVEEIKYVMCNAFGFGGTNAVMVMGK